MLGNEYPHGTREAAYSLVPVAVEVQAIATIDLVHDMAQWSATVGRDLPQPQPNQRLDVDVGVSTRANSDAVNIVHSGILLAHAAKTYETAAGTRCDAAYT